VQPIPGAPQEAEAQQPRLTRAQASKAAQAQDAAAEDATAGTEGTTPSDGGADPMILLHVRISFSPSLASLSYQLSLCVQVGIICCLTTQLPPPPRFL